MKNLKDFSFKINTKIEFVLTDIDDTLTTEGQLGAAAYSALWQLHNNGLKIIPITGRPAGWCELIARMWPVAGIVGENGGFYFQYKNKKMHRWFASDTADFQANRKKLDLIQTEVLKAVPKAGIASDQFCRLMDLAIDFCEDVPALSETDVQKIAQVFKQHGAQAKISSIHVNGWFGNYNKLSTTLQFLKDGFGLSEEDALKKCAFVGDSPNDEPMFQKFPHSFGVANVQDFKSMMQHLPTYISTGKGGEGFSEIAEHILLSSKKI